MILEVLIGVVVVIGVLLLIVTLLPSGFRVSRSQSMAVTPDLVFPHVNTLKSWEAWSPFEKMDSKMKKTYSGPESGVGASVHWVGNFQAGEGKNTILASEKNDSIQFKLEMIKPFKGTNAVEFTFKPEGRNTTVSWTMTGKMAFIPKIIGLFMSMDRMIGSSFEEGLLSLKTIVEASVHPEAVKV
jgi:hypothetical protein